MSNTDAAASLSPRRQRLSSFENSYAVALQRQRQTGVSQFILRTANPLQLRTAEQYSTTVAAG